MAQLVARAAAALVVSSSLVSFPALVACGSEADVDVDGTSHLITSGALDAAAILRFVNSAAATEQVLDVDVSLDSRAAAAIVAHVWGNDERFGTSDDNHCDNLDELDAISYVGDSALRALDAYVAAHAAPTPAPGPSTGEDVVVESVTFTASEAASAIAHCNERSEAQLDDDVGLDSRAAHAIVGARPHASLDTIANAAYVGASALEKIRAYARLHPVDVTPPPGPGGGAGTVRILSLTAAVHTDVDPEWEETLDGVLTRWSTSGATSCDLDIRTTTGVLLEQQPNVGTSGERFDAGWLVENTTYPNVAVVLTCRNATNVTAVASASTEDGTPPVVVTCDATGGTYDGVAFTAAEECAAAKFMNQARWSQMGALSDAARRIAYDGSPSGELGQRLSSWTNVAAFSALGGVGRTAVESLKSASSTWSDDGRGRFDTVALTWQNRAALAAANAPISLDRVFVTRKTVDFAWPDTQRACIEIRDAPDAPNYMEACLFFINADSAPGCTDHSINDCLNVVVNDYAKIRGRVRVASNGRVSISMHHDGPLEPRASLD